MLSELFVFLKLFFVGVCRRIGSKSSQEGIVESTETFASSLNQNLAEKIQYAQQQINRPPNAIGE